MAQIILGNPKLRFIKGMFYAAPPPPPPEYLTIEALEDDFQIEFYNDCNAQYSLNEGPWTPFDDSLSPVMNA